MEDKEQFFSQKFWQYVVAQCIVGVFLLVIALVTSLVVTGKLDTMIALVESTITVLERVESTIETVAGIDSAQMSEKASVLSDSATEIGEGLGDGGAETVNRIRDALQGFNKADE